MVLEALKPVLLTILNTGFREDFASSSWAGRDCSWAGRDYLAPDL
jgi:hypothetical protein